MLGPAALLICIVVLAASSGCLLTRSELRIEIASRPRKRPPSIPNPPSTTSVYHSLLKSPSLAASRSVVIHLVLF